MIMVKGLVLYDYDGTLVDERDEIYVPTQLTKAAISRLQDLGYLCVLATGRALSY
ncbi:MAG: HAD hydrolase family protein, partial [[Clostridium] innocuum]